MIDSIADYSSRELANIMMGEMTEDDWDVCMEKHYMKKAYEGKTYYLDDCYEKDSEGNYYCAGCDQPECNKRQQKRILGYVPSGYENG